MTTERGVRGILERFALPRRARAPRRLQRRVSRRSWAQSHDVNLHASVTPADLEYERVNPGAECGRPGKICHKYIPLFDAVAAVTVLK